MRSDVPVLVVIGIFGPYVRPGQARASLAGLQHLALVVSPTDGHNVVPKTDCMLKIRKAWLNRPSANPTGSECFANAQIAWERPAD